MRASAESAVTLLFAALLVAPLLAGCTGASRDIPSDKQYAAPRPTSAFPSAGGATTSGSSSGSSSGGASSSSSSSSSSGGASSSSSSSSSSGGTIVDRDAPAIAGPTVTPNSMRFTGGTAAVSANVTDNVGVQRVWAEVTKPDGSTTEVDLAASSPPAYSGTWTVPLHTTAGSTVTYSFRVRAQDAAGNAAAADSVTLTVQLPAAPPANSPL